MDLAARADANFVVHVTWALPRTAGMVSRVRDDLVAADSGLACDTFNFVCRARLEPVATAEATVCDGTGGLYNISTLAAFRGKGTGSALTWLPLRDARDAGNGVGVLQAAPDGVGIYRRLGFLPFGNITQYKPGPDSEAA